MTLGLGRLSAVGMVRGLTGGSTHQRDLREAAADKLREGAPVTRAEAAAFLSVSTRKLQRMEAAGLLRRCGELDGVVRYAASDVLRLASAR